MAHFVVRRTHHGFAVHARQGKEVRQVSSSFSTAREAGAYLRQNTDLFYSPEDEFNLAALCACGRDTVGNLGTHCLQCELEPFGVAWQLEQDGRL